MDDLKSTIVIDLGSGYTKAGLAGNDHPNCIVPTTVERLNDDDIFPIEHGIIRNFDQIEHLLDHLLHEELHIRPTEHAVLLTQPPKNPQKDKEKLAEIMFEKFQAPALYEEINSVLTFYSAGRDVGLIVESGHGLTTVVPILSGYAISEAILRLDVGGGDVDHYLAKLLNEKSTYNNIKLSEARLLKENLCFVPAIDRNAFEEDTFILPDGRSVTLEEERHRATGPLFDPALVEQYDTSGIHEMIFQSIYKCGFDLRRNFASNIVLSGGNTLFKGLEDRLREELEARVPASMSVNIITDPDRKIFAWRGGSILGSLSTFVKNICVSRREYEEFGGSIVKKKCMNGL